MDDHRRQYSVVEVNPPPVVQTVYVVDEDDVPPIRQHWANQAFADKSRRMAFVRKVLGTVLLQLLLCAAITAVFVFSTDSVKLWVLRHYYIGYIAGILWMTISIAVGCCNVGRGPPSPFNISLLIFGTIFLSILCAFISVGYSQNVILYALASTVLILLVIVIITAFTPIDITGCGMLLFCGMLALFVGSLMAGIVLGVSSADRSTMRVVGLVICVLCIVLLTMFILYDLQLIVGGRKHQLEEDDWLFACLMLFGNIINLFMQLLNVFGFVQN